jgi:prepilin-type N-terminal cleavage/methylation domain-containing protein
MKTAVFPLLRRGFTLVEMLVAMAILAVIVMVLAVVLGNVSGFWVSTQSRIETFRNGRAALEFVARDLAALQQPVGPRSDATASATPVPLGSVQFVQDAGHASSGLTPLLGAGYEQVPNSSSVFGQARLGSSSLGDLAVLGYYLVRSTSGDRYELRRFFVSPSTGATNAVTNSNYKLYAGNAQAANGYPNTPAWIYQAGFATNSYPISENVIGFWVRCLDRAGNPIPWLKDNANAGTGTAPYKFNSAAAFQMYSPTSASDTNTFVYLKSTAVPANQLPAALEVTLITLDSRALKKTIPLMTNAPVSAADVPTKIAAYQKALNDAGITTAKTFSTVVKLGAPR